MAMFKLKGAFWAWVSAVAICSAALAADEKEKYGEKAEGADQAKAAVYKHDQIVDLKVVDRNGQELGQIEDLVVTLPEGKIRYAAVSGEQLTQGDDQFLALPWAALKIKPQQEGQQQAQQEGQQQDRRFGFGDREEMVAELQVDAEMLAQAAGFPKDQDWPAQPDEQLASNIEQQVGQERTEVGFRGTETQQPGEQRSVAARMSNLIDMTVKTQDQEDVADVEHMAIDTHQGRVVYITIGAGGFLGLGETNHALPPDALELRRSAEDSDERFLLLKLDKAQLKEAPEVKDDADTATVVAQVKDFQKTHFKAHADHQKQDQIQAQPQDQIQDETTDPGQEERPELPNELPNEDQ